MAEHDSMSRVSLPRLSANAPAAWKSVAPGAAEVRPEFESLPAGAVEHSSRLVRWFYPTYYRSVKALRGSRISVRLLFGVRLPPGIYVSWDHTTLVLRRALARHCHPGVRALEIGVGRGALLSLYLAKRRGVHPDGVDIVRDHVECAALVARYNGAPLALRQSDLFAEARGRYDLVFFNSVYIPTSFGREFELARRRNYDDPRGWHGGADGAEVIREFLRQAPAHLARQGEILLGVNNFYVDDRRMRDLIERSGLRLVQRVRQPFNPSTAYVLRLRDLPTPTSVVAGAAREPALADGRARPLGSTSLGTLVLKRCFDLAFSATMLIALCWLFALIAVAVQCDSPGPVVFRQQRVGRRGESFTIYKFRSMHTYVDPLAISPKDFADVRITRVGRVIRRLGLDELPQLWNILRGDMSVVGPRPQLANELEEFRGVYDSLLSRRLAVRPGLTSSWALAEDKEKTRPVPEMLIEDCRYVDKLAFGRDLQLVWGTLKHVLSRR